MKIWGYDGRIREERADEIIAAIKSLNLDANFTIVDVACGDGQVLLKVSKAFPSCKPLWIDIDPPITIIPIRKQAVQDFIKEQGDYDVVLMLNSYRNWEGKDKEQMDRWLAKHARYFITSFSGQIIGKDTFDYPMIVLDVQRSK